MSEAHTEGMIALHADPEVLRHIGDGKPYPAEATARMVRGMAGRWPMEGFGWFALLEREGGGFVGAAALQHMDLNPRKPMELAWRVSPGCWGRGFATEAAAEIARFAFEDLEFQAAYAVARPANLASIRVMEKIGMTFVGVEHHWGEDLPTYRLTPGALIQPQ
jgi:RimJ/RimL family protein N-acetyltransferase